MCNSSGILEHLKPRVDELLQNSISANTQATYHKGIKSFLHFQSQQSLPKLWPPPVDHIINYIAFLSCKGTSYATVRSYLAGISFNLKINSLPDPCSFFIVKKLLSGYRRTSWSKDSRSPITLPLLINILNALPNVCTNTFEIKLFALAFSLAYFAILRVGEITHTNPTHSNALSIHNTLLSSHSIKLVLTKTKTDPIGVGTTLIITFQAENRPLFVNLQSYLSIRPNYPGQLLCHIDGSPLTYYQFNQVLKRALSFLKIDTSTFKSHSFRIGAATHMYLQGIPENDIKVKGRWRSDAFKSYIRPQSVYL